VSWWHVVVSLERHGYTQSAIAAAIDSKRTTVLNWKNNGASPRHKDGERLIELWCAVMQQGRDELPLKVGQTLSAAQFR
jgi:hypothetical protein